MAGQLLDRGGVEQIGVVAELDGELPPGKDDGHERVVGRLDGLQVVQSQAVRGGELVVDRVVLEHHDAVEQGHPARQVAPGLQIRE